MALLQLRIMETWFLSSLPNSPRMRGWLPRGRPNRFWQGHTSPWWVNKLRCIWIHKALILWIDWTVISSSTLWFIFRRSAHLMANTIFLVTCYASFRGFIFKFFINDAQKKLLLSPLEETFSCCNSRSYTAFQHLCLSTFFSNPVCSSPVKWQEYG